MNCKAVSGEPRLLDCGDDLIDLGLRPLGVTSANEGTKGRVGSGVRGCGGGDIFSRACSSEAELIHLSA